MIFIRTLIPDPLLITYAAILTYSVVCTILVTPLVRRFALKTNFVDIPDPRRVHDGVIPNIGGIAFAFTFISGLLLSSLIHPSMALFVSDKFIGLFAATCIIIVAGLYDDARGLNFIQKFSVQALVGCILYFTGYHITTIPTLFFEPIQLGWLSLPVTVLWVSALCNAVNLIDGLDGLASGLVSITSAIFFFLSLLQHDVVGAIMSIMLAGITASFLYYNFYPAKIFMGDTGSLFLGLILACMVIEKMNFVQVSHQTIPLVIILGIPVFDMTLTIIRRAIKKRHLFRADRLHVHHRLIDVLGMSHKQAVLTLYGWSVCFGSIGFIVTFGENNVVLFGCGIILAILSYGTTKLHYFKN